MRLVPAFWALAVLASISGAASAAERGVSFRHGKDEFTAVEATSQAAVADTNRLITLAQERFSITLDRSETSIVDLQRLAEQVRGELRLWERSGEPSRAEVQEWSRLIVSYLGEVLVAHRGAHWGRTNILGGSERALGFPKGQGIQIVDGQMAKFLQSASNICGWYLIAASTTTAGKSPEAVVECSKQPWQKSEAEQQHSAAVQNAIDAAKNRELEARKTSRTSAEIQEAFRRAAARVADLFHARNVPTAGRVAVGLTVSPGGEVTEAHVISSDFGSNPELEEEILKIVRGMRFEARDVPPYTSPGLAFRYNPDG